MRLFREESWEIASLKSLRLKKMENRIINNSRNRIMLLKKLISGKKGQKPIWAMFLSLAAFFIIFGMELVAQTNPYYEFSLKLRRMGDQIGAEVWVKTLRSDAPKLGSFSFPINHGATYLEPAALNYAAYETDSIDYDVNQSSPYPYREIESPFHNTNGYEAITVSNGTGYSEIEITFNGDATTEGFQPASTGRGTFVGIMIFDIENHATLDTSDFAGITIRSHADSTPRVSIADVNGDAISNSNVTLTDPDDIKIIGISILNPNGPFEAVNRGAQYPSLGDVAGYPVYFERSGLVNTGTYSYGTPALAYSLDYSLDSGVTWKNNAIRFAETTSSLKSSTTDILTYGELETNTGLADGYSVTKANGFPLTSSGDGYGGVLRIIWDDNQFFPYRSEKAKIRLVQLESTNYDTSTNIRYRDRDTVIGESDTTFILSRLFFVQLNGTDEYLKTREKFENATQLTVEAWVNLNRDDYGESDEPGIVVCSNGPTSPEEGAWMLYLEEGKYPAFRAREIEGRGINSATDPSDIYVAKVMSPYELSYYGSDFDLKSSDTSSENHRKNWTHLAATVRNNVVTLYVNGEIVDQKTNNSAVDILMYSHMKLPVWIGINPNEVDNLDDATFFNGGVKEVRVWRMALTPDQILERAAGIYDVDGTVTDLDETGRTGDIRPELEIYYPLQGSRDDAANHQYQNYYNYVDFYKENASGEYVINNDYIDYRPDKAHIKLITPAGGEGICNLADHYYRIKWIGYGVGSVDPNTDDIMIQYSRNGVDWDDAQDSTTSPSGRPMYDLEIEDGSSIWEPYNSVTLAGLYHDLQGVSNPADSNYNKKVLVKISGSSANNQSDISYISDTVYVAPYFAMQNNGGAFIYVPGTDELNLSTGVSFIEAWIRPHRFPTTEEVYFPIIQKYDSAAAKHHYALKLLSTGQLQFEITNQSGSTVHIAKSDEERPVIDANVEDVDLIWTHVGVLVDLHNGNSEADVIFYIDGVPQYDTTFKDQLDATIDIDYRNTYPVYIGYQPGGNTGFIGDIKEVRYWNGYPAGINLTGVESVENPTELTKFIQGALTVRASDLAASPTNFQDNLVAAFEFNGGSLLNDGYNKSIGSTDSDISAYIRGPVGVGSGGCHYVPTYPYIKLVEPVYDQKVPNTETALRVRWVGFDFDANNFYVGDPSIDKHADLEASTEGGGGDSPIYFEPVASENYDDDYTNALSFPETDKYRFDGSTDSVQYAASLNFSITDPDLNNDEDYQDQGPISAAKKNGRFRMSSRATINSEGPWEYTDIASLRNVGPQFYITPPSNFTVRVILEGFHSGYDEVITEVGEKFSNQGLRITLYNEIAGAPGDSVAAQESSYGYENSGEALNAGASPVRGQNGSVFANVPFIFTDLADGDYYVVVEHRNHLPIMSRYTAPFQFLGDSLETWAIESGWDFQSWGQNLDDNTDAPASTDYMLSETDSIYRGKGLFTAYGAHVLTSSEVGFDMTGLNFTQGRETSLTNRLAAMVAGDVVYDGQINNSDRIQVRNDIGSTDPRSDVTGDGDVNALDRDIVDRNSNKITSLRDISVITYGVDGKEEEKPMFSWVSQENPLEHVSTLDPEQSIRFNEAAKQIVAAGGEPITMFKGNNRLFGGISYRVTAIPVKIDNTVEVSIYLTNTGDDFAPGNCTFALEYDPNILEYSKLVGIEDSPFNDRYEYGYSRQYSAPKVSALDPVSNVRTIEIDYDGYVRQTGINAPHTPTKLGTLVFDIRNLANSYGFKWHPMSIVLRTDGKDLTGLGEFEEIEDVNIVRDVTITYPNGGEELTAGRTHIISWSKANVDYDVHVEFSIDAGQSWQRISDAPVSVLDRNYNWKSPRIRTTEALVRLVNADDGTVVDQSDQLFSLLPAPSQITRPAASDPIYVAGADDFIRWNVEEALNVRFEFSENGEDNWIVVTPTVNTQAKETPWQIPAVNSKRCVIRMVVAETNEIIASSEPFRILAGKVELTTPKEGEIANVGEDKAVRWIYDNVDRFDLQISYDNGETWSEFIEKDVYAPKMNYQWTVPNAVTDYAIIRALWNADPDMEYSRTGVFKIVNKNTGVEELANIGFNFAPIAPNPFAGEAEIKFTLPTENMVSIYLYNSVGTHIATLVENEIYPAGTSSIKLTGYDLSNGVYFIRIKAGEFDMMRDAVHFE